MSVALYRGRLAPSPTGYLHLGHARTFWMAQQRALTAGGTLLLRNEDLDHARCRAEFVSAMIEDLRWFGLSWEEGPDCGGPFGPYSQSERRAFYLDAFERLLAAGVVYPCTCSRKDVQRALQAPHPGEDEPIYPGTCRNKLPPDSSPSPGVSAKKALVNATHQQINWRFRVPDGETIAFTDGHYGPQSFIAGQDFGDFILWRHDYVPAYQLAVTVDDGAMKITEVVRGADLLRSAVRQILIYKALGHQPPAFYHCPLMTDESGQRLAKRHDALSLRALRNQGRTPEDIRAHWCGNSSQACLS